MALRYFVGSGTNWSSTASWSTGSGGSSGAAVPTAADDVILDAASPGNLTIDVASVCRSLDASAFTHTLTMSANLTIGTSSTNGSLALKLGASMTFTGTSGNLTFNFSVGTQVQMTSAGKSWGAVAFVFGGTTNMQLQDALTATNGGGSALIVATSATLATNNQTLSISGTVQFQGNCNVTLGSSSITCGIISASTTMTLAAGTSSITFNGTTSFGAAGKTWYDVSFTSSTGNVLGLSGGGTFHNVTRAFAGANNAQFTFVSSGAQTTYTITGTLTLTSTTAGVRMLAYNNVAVSNSPDLANQGGGAVVNAAAVSLQNIDFMDINAAGAAAPFTGTSLGDAGNNTNITFPAGRTLYLRQGQVGVMSLSTWSLTSGGAAITGDYPLPQDTMTIDASVTYSSATTLTGMPQVTGKWDTRAYAGTGVISIGNSGNNIFVVNDLYIGAQTKWNQTGSVNLVGRGAHTLSVATTLNGAPNVITDSASTWSLAADLTLQTQGLTVTAGGFATANHSLTCSTLTILSNGFRGGTSTITIAGSGVAFTLNTPTPQTADLSSTTINFTNTASAISFTLTGNSQPNILGAVNFAAGSNALNLGASGCPVSFASLSIPGTTARTVTFTNATTTIRNASGWQVSGTAGHLLTVLGAASSVWILSCASGIVSSDYLSMTNSHATGGASFYAGANSTNVSGNTGWSFTAAPRVVSRTWAVTQAQATTRQAAIATVPRQLTQAQALVRRAVVARSMRVSQGQAMTRTATMRRTLRVTQAASVALHATVRRTIAITQGAIVTLSSGSVRHLLIALQQTQSITRQTESVRHLLVTLPQPQSVAMGGGVSRRFVLTQNQTVSVTAVAQIVPKGSIPWATLTSSTSVPDTLPEEAEPVATLVGSASAVGVLTSSEAT